MQKTKKKTFRDYTAEDLLDVKFAVNTVQVNEIREASGDGIFKVGKDKFSKSYAFSDNDYMLRADDIEAKENRSEILESLAEVYRSMSCDIQENIINLYSGDEIKNPCLVKERDDGLNPLRKEYNAMTDRRLSVRSEIKTIRLITLTVEANDFDAARVRFSTLETQLETAYEKMGSILTPLRLEERMKVFYKLQNPGAPDRDYSDLQKRNIRETLALKTFGYVHPGAIRTIGASGEWLTRVYYIKEYPDLLDDDFLTNIIQSPYHLSISKYMRPLPVAVSKELLLTQLDRVRKHINKEQDNNNKAGHFRSNISYLRQTEERNLTELLNDLADSNEKLFVTNVCIAVWGRSEEELNTIEQSLIALCEEKSVELAQYMVSTRQAYMSALPLGLRFVRTRRILNSVSLAGLVPYYAEDIASDSEENIYYGINHYTKHIIAADRRKMLRQHGIVIGATGAGKSMGVKNEMKGVMLATYDDIIVIDPQGEYKKMVDGLEPHGAYYDCGVNSNLRFNPLAIQGEVNEDKMQRKMILMNGIMAALMKESFLQKHQDTLEIAVKKMYQTRRKFTVATLKDVLNKMGDEESPVAKDLALAMNRLTEGTMNIFDDNPGEIEYKRYTVFGLGGGENKEDVRTAIIMMVILDYVSSRIADNFLHRTTTRVYVDEMQRIMNREKTAELLADFWQTTRKFRAICTGITPSSRNLFNSIPGRNILDNAGFKMVFPLEKTSRDEARELFELSQVHVDFLKKAKPGSAVMIFDGRYYLMDGQVEEDEKDTRIYKMASTNPYEA